jgi:hypothetical protein
MSNDIIEKIQFKKKTFEKKLGWTQVHSTAMLYASWNQNKKKIKRKLGKGLKLYQLKKDRKKILE